MNPEPSQLAPIAAPRDLGDLLLALRLRLEQYPAERRRQGLRRAAVFCLEAEGDPITPTRFAELEARSHNPENLYLSYLSEGAIRALLARL